MRILVETNELLAERLRALLEGHDVVSERSYHLLDVACVDGDPVQAQSLARSRPDMMVIFFGHYEHLDSLVEAHVCDVIPVDKNLEARLKLTLARIERETDGAETKLLELFKELPDGVVISTDQKIAFANKSFAEMLLDDSRKLVGRSCSSLAHPDDAEHIRAQDAECLLHGVSPTVAETRLLRSDGSTLNVHALTMPLVFRGQASVVRFVRSQPRRREFDDQMVLADRMASVGTLAAGVAHELNNPLAYVLANLQMCRESMVRSEPKGLLEQLDTAIQGAHRMADIVRDLKTFARQPSTTTDVVDVKASLRSALHMCENELRHRGTLHLHLGEVPSVQINASRLCQVFVNLLINAAQAIEGVEKGAVTVSASTDERGWACVEIQDNGPGIPAEVMHRIFEPFFTTKAAIEGTGLGLSICRNLVTQANGELHVESAPNSGAKFSVYLPPTMTKRRVKKLSSKPPAGARADILVIDDEHLIGRAMQRALGAHHVTVTTSGAEALEALEAHRFDLVFCDLMMPALSGMEVYRQAVERDPSLARRFVFMTGGAFTPGARAFIAETTSLVIEKPFNLRQVRSIAAEYVVNASGS